MKGFTLLLTLVVGLLGLSHGQCPPPEVMAPCDCIVDGTRTAMHCNDIQDPNFNMKQVFDRASEFVDADVVFSQLFIQNLTISEIEEGTVEHLKFNSISINWNYNLERISSRAFGATRNTTTSLSLYGNSLRNEAPREREIFDLINGFERIGWVRVGSNRLTSIPANALQNARSLTTLEMDSNQISHIGSNAFNSSQAPRLDTLNLRLNSIPAEGLPEDAFEGIRSSATVDLRQNGMSFLEQKSYQGVLDRAYRVHVGAWSCGIAGCFYSRVFDCDERADWICDREDDYRLKLGDGFACKLFSGYENVWRYCAARNNKLH